MGQHINCIITFSFVCLYQKLLNFTVVGHVILHTFLSHSSLHVNILKKNIAHVAIAWYLGVQAGMWRRQSQGPGVELESRAVMEPYQKPSLLWDYCLFPQDNKLFFVVECSWTRKFCSLTLHESKWILWALFFLKKKKIN